MIELPIIVDLTVNKSKQVYEFDIENNSPEIEFTLRNGIVFDYPVYDGEYVVDAGYDPVVLETKDKVLLQNVTVNRLPENEIYIHTAEINDDTGMLRSTAAVTPGYNDGFLFSSFRHQLRVVEADTITPALYEQTIATKGMFVTGTVKVAAVPAYTGATTITPSDQTQVIEVRNTMPATNITVNPVPSNYGKISWNGSYLKVS